MERTADPYLDTDVIDARAPRFNQAVVATVSLVALATGWWGLTAALALQLILGLTLGRSWCLPCVIYFEIVQPRFGEGAIEDARAPRFANVLGATFLSAATLAHLASLSTLGWIAIGMVAALATLAVTTGICVGCTMYRLLARARGIRPGTASRIDLTELDVPNERTFVVQFTHPLCTGCTEVTERLSGEGHELVLVDVSQRTDLARKYNVSIVPLALSVSSEGRVLERLA
ncbi:MAG TPA: DUF4395 domain-containing protein [Actinomycetota bacterium]|nr:DUF4395 domain-containing protein [Actinomycetota bacterium]